MPIVASEVVWRRSEEVSSLPTNGGRMSSVASTSGVKNSIFPDVSEQERTDGSTVYRKQFVHIANPEDLGLLNAKLFVAFPTPGDDYVVLVPGTQTDRRSNLTGSERVYGAGKLNANVSVGATTVAVAVDGGDVGAFQAGDLIRISDKAGVGAEEGNTQFVRIATGGVSAYTGNVVTLTLDSALLYAFLATNTYVSSVQEAGTVRGTVAGFVVNSAGGTYDSTTYPIIVSSIGGVQQAWTLTFTSATSFTITGDTLGLIGTFNRAAIVQPANPNYGVPYFTMEVAGWGGTFTAGDTIAFTTSPAAVPIWYKRVIPPGAATLAGNSVTVGVEGESESET